MLLAVTIWLGVRRSFWVAVGPVLAVTFWFALLTVVEYFFDGTA